MVVITFGQIGIAIFVFLVLVLVGVVSYQVGRGSRSVDRGFDCSGDPGYSDPEASQRYLDRGRLARYGPQSGDKVKAALDWLDDYDWGGQ